MEVTGHEAQLGGVIDVTCYACVYDYALLLGIKATCSDLL